MRLSEREGAEAGRGQLREGAGRTGDCLTQSSPDPSKRGLPETRGL